MRNVMKINVVSLLRHAALALALTTASGMASASLVHVTIDTASFGAGSGFIDMNLSATVDMPLATATVTKLVGFQSAPTIDSWGVTAVPGGWRFRNDTANDLFQSVDFGGLLSFDLAIEGAFDPAAVFISVFSVSAFGSDGMTPLGNYNALTGALAEISWTPTAMAGTDGRIGISIADPAVTVVPEPALSALMGVGLAALGLGRRRRNAALPARLPEAGVAA